MLITFAELDLLASVAIGLYAAKRVHNTADEDPFGASRCLIWLPVLRLITPGDYYRQRCGRTIGIEGFGRSANNCSRDGKIDSDETTSLRDAGNPALAVWLRHATRV